MGLRDAPRVVRSDGTVSIVKIVSLFPHVEYLKVKKLIKVSYLNQESRQYFRIPMYVNVLRIRIFYVSVSWIYYTFCVRTELLYISSNWSSNTCSSV